MFTDEDIMNLLNCEKQIIDPPSKDYKNDRAHRKKNFTMRSIDENFSFYGFIRVSIHFIENFSIGLEFPNG